MPRRKRAYRQGCGIYSVVNALRYLLQLKEEDRRALFGTLVEALHQGCRRPHQQVLWGIPVPKLKRLVEAARGCEFLDWGQTFKARTLRLRREQRNLPGLWATLAQEVRPRCVAVIGITGATDYWCVAYRVTPKTGSNTAYPLCRVPFVRRKASPGCATAHMAVLEQLGRSCASW